MDVSNRWRGQWTAHQNNLFGDPSILIEGRHRELLLFHCKHCVTQLCRGLHIKLEVKRSSVIKLLLQGNRERNILIYTAFWVAPYWFILSLLGIYFWISDYIKCVHVSPRNRLNLQIACRCPDISKYNHTTLGLLSANAPYLGKSRFLSKMGSVSDIYWVMLWPPRRRLCFHFMFYLKGWYLWMCII